MPPDEQIQKWKDEFGDIYCVTVGEDKYYLKKPKRPEYKRFIDTVAQSTYDASLTLVNSCLLDPAPQDFMRKVEENPGIHLLISAEIQNKMGGDLTVSSKNL